MLLYGEYPFVPPRGGQAAPRTSSTAITHGSQQGLHNGQLAVGWLAYILSQADHRKSAVPNGLSHTLHHLLGHPIRTVDFNDDRLGALLRRTK
jgi:hypothetical protein